MQSQLAGEFGESGRGSDISPSGGISEAQIEALKEAFYMNDNLIVGYAKWIGDVLQGDLRKSIRYQEPVWNMVKERLPISIYYGIATFVITYCVCIPLGILKALKHHSPIDTVTSVTIFVGYAIPGYAIGSLLVVFVAARLGWFPTGGFHSDEFYDLSFWGKALDIVYHSILPLICYVIGSFAFLTMLMKNTLLDNLAQDYMRFAMSKGTSFKRAVFGHALRNSFIPIATGVGHFVSIFLTGSFLIEVVFDIDGFGLLGYNSLVERDYPVVMGVLLLSGTLLVVGNILSDAIVAWVDPRVSFE